MNIVLDTYPLIQFFKDEEKAEKVRDVLVRIERGEIRGSISSLTVSELFYILARFKGSDFARIVLNYIKASNINVIGVDTEIAEKGGEFKFIYGGKGSKKGLPIADAIIAATAWKEKAMLVTTDEHFGKIREIKLKLL